MRKLSTRVLSLVLALILSLSAVGANAIDVFAAEAPSISISPLVTGSADVQQFYVSTTAPANYIATYAGATEQGTIASEATLTFNTRADIDLEVFAGYDNDGTTEYVTAYSSSIHAYWVYVNGLADDGTELFNERIKLSKYNEPEVVYNAPAVIEINGIEYTAQNASVLFNYGDSSKTIAYTAEAMGAKNITINYVDDLDAVINTETKVLNYGESTVISAPASFAAGGNTYTLKTTATYDVTYANAQSVYTFEYAKQAPQAQLPYNITVKLVDENGNTLNTIQQSVDVGKTVTVNLPATYTVGLKQYALAAGQASSVVHEYANTASKTYTANYVLASEAKAYTVTISLVDQATGKVLDTVAGTVEPDGVPFTYDISSKNKIQKDGVTYWVVSGQGNSKGKIVHAYGDAAKSYTLYYSAKKDSIAQPYTVTMRYICVNDDAVLSTTTKTVEVNSSVTFDVAPETLKVNNKEYIRLNGQSGETVHKYNDNRTTYEIYYRDASIVDNKDDVIYVPGTGADQNETTKPTEPKPTEPKPTEPNPTEPQPTTPRPTNPTQPTNPQPTTPGTTGSNTTVNPGDNETQVTTPGDADENATVENEGEETENVDEPDATVAPEAETEDEATAQSEEVEIIDEDEVPLANMPADGASNGPSAMPFVAGGIGLLAIIALAIFFIVKKRRTA